ncbi:MAG: CHAT domain-containing protein [Ferruginibacter sp.]|nr:CHAT domain-containing protein [Ferruginibacter sp.]
MKKIVVRGFKTEQLPPAEAQSAKDSKLELKASYQFSTSRAAAPVHELEFEKTDVLEFVFDDNTSWMGSSDIIHDIFPEAANQKRAANESFEIPMYLKTDEANRGLLGDIAVKVLNVFAKKAVSQKVIDIATRLEKKALENMSGVYAVDANFRLGKATIKNADKPYLLFLHGTNSSTAGSFGELRGSELWANMQSIYGQNIIALQHETMTRSPIQNVISLFKALPQTCTLHVISHSRGGLVGDVLARFSNGNTGFTPAELAYLAKTERAEDVADIKTLQQLASGKNVVVDKFIRVACPAYGTTILSKRLDHFLNISLNLLGTLFGPVGAALTSEFKELISAAVDTKNDPDQLPGLEAMNPASPFLKVLNNPDNAIKGPLTVISGNCGIKFNLKALLIIASKLFYLRDNDLVVDTKSMYCGSRRNIPIQYFFDEGPEVDHVHYFKNKKTQDALLLALKTTTATIPNFVTYQQSLQAALERNALLGLDGGDVYTDKVTGKKPIAILLPGIMGSNLADGKNKVWINYARFLIGELSRLDISKKNITAPSLIRTSYKKLVDYLSAEYDVVTFAFDWRMPLAEAAELLKAKIEQYLAFKVPIKIIGHSMGGVVTRDFIINHPATWNKLNSSKDFKLILLGAPLGGSYRIPYVLAGKDSIINQIAKIDLKHTKKELLDMFRRYPGLLGLLPLAKEDKRDFADENTWLEMKKASLFDWNIPDKKDLQFWGNYRDNVLAKMESIKMDNIIYIAGKDDATVCGYEINNALPDEKIIFKSTAEGDQSVTWETGIPKQLLTTDRLYYVNVSHGALANNADIFNGIAEILKNGKTELLSRNRPVLRGAGAVEFDTVEEEVYETDELSLEQNILGIKEKPAAGRAATVPLKVSVSNGDLFYSRYPIMVGHFINDGITSAERVIDNYSGGQLSQRHKLNMYPGAVGTNEVFVNFKNEFKGTVVIGLGAPGRLSSYQLAQTVEQGVIKYMLELINLYNKKETAYLPAETGISVLHIGCGYGGLSIESSIRSIILGVQNANRKMEEFQTEGLKLIEHIEFVELFEDRCMQCLYILSRIENEEDSSINIRLPKKQYKKLLGSRTRIPMESEMDWWSRITVEMHQQKDEGSEELESSLRFSCSTGSAREEERDLQTSPEIINELIEEMSTNNNWNAGIAKTVFELLIPNDFKDEIKKQSNALWVLDHAAASYPWELLQDSTTNSRPLCCSAGMIRQLKLEDYRLKVDGVVGKKALVVGDPDLNGFPFARQLPGAFKEGHLVASILSEYGYEMPNNCFKKSSTQIINALFKDEYKIIHLAGHGIFNEKRPKASGMLIGNGVFLSTKEICQMSKVPELVFVNCCFLGKVDDKSEALFNKRYKLAANIGTQLISNGVKVVIAAGWAVDDSAALYFTGIFYHAMLGGSNFGDAVKDARAKTFAKYPNTNTWGAYQCYGDPFFKLTEYKRPKGYTYKYLIAQEAENDLSNLINRADTKGNSSKYLLQDIAAISAAVDAAGIRNAAITEKEALAYDECNDDENAVAKFESLLCMEQADFSLIALEKYCNTRTKLCVKNWQSGVEKNKQPAKLDKVIIDLKQLLNMSPTAERLGLMGSAYKRKAIMSTANTDKAKALMVAAGYYKQAYHMPHNSNATYALINWMEIEKILQLAKNMAGVKTVIKKYKFETAGNAREMIDAAVKKMISADADIDFWSEITKANAILCAWLMEGKNTKKLTDNMVIEAYKKVWGIAGSQNKKVAEIEHFDFLISAYSGLAKKPANVAAIKKIKRELEKIIR